MPWRVNLILGILSFSEIDKINLISSFDIIQPEKFSTFLDEGNYFRSQQSTCTPRVMITFWVLWYFSVPNSYIKHLKLGAIPSHLKHPGKKEVTWFQNYESYYRSTRLQVLTSFEQFWTLSSILIHLIYLSRSILVYLYLSWFFSVYLGSAQFILIYFDLSWSILIYNGLS